MSRIEEDFELELRSLPGVLNVGFDRSTGGDVDTVTLVVRGVRHQETESVALQIASLYYPEAGVVVEDVDESPATVDSGAPRVVLVRCDFDAVDGECEVELRYRSRTGVGRAANGPLIGGVEATLAALGDLGIHVPYTLMSVSNMIAVRSWPVVVVLHSVTDGSDRFGIAQSDNDVSAAAKATLSAVNRLALTMKDTNAE